MSRRMRRTHRGTGAAAIKGAIAGAVATWLMGQITSYMYQRENKEAREAEDKARNGKTAYGVAAEKVAGLAGRSLDDQQRERVGLAIHWAIGIGTGALYAVLGRRFAGVGRLGGAAFGTAFWGVVDEGLVSGLGLTPGPTAFPWQAHARGLAGHLTFGTVTDATLRVLDAVA
jgi:uncharacterized membrane protein YagU involved in acid resistance